MACRYLDTLLASPLPKSTLLGGLVPEYASQNRKIKVLYIAGFGRSGSTILDNLLGQVDGFFSAGELCYIWDHHLAEEGLCGCGYPLKECAVWGKVLAEDDVAGINAREMSRLERGGVRTRHLPLALLPRGRKLLASRLAEYAENLEKTYRTVGRMTGARVIVDSSKNPLYGRVLDTIPSIDFYVVHLVRDPRAAAYSWLRKKLQPDRGEGGYMDRPSPVKSSVMWTVWNAAATVFWGRSPDRYLALRYEDLVVDPRAALGRILRMVGEMDRDLPFVDGYEVELEVSHTVAGNPNRFKTGKVKLRLDDEWKGRMRLRDRLVVTLLTLPGLLRYGYPAALTPKAPNPRAGE